jgi:hypothetical protein
VLEGLSGWGGVHRSPYPHIAASSKLKMICRAEFRIMRKVQEKSATASDPDDVIHAYFENSFARSAARMPCTECLLACSSGDGFMLTPSAESGALWCPVIRAI